MSQPSRPAATAHEPVEESSEVAVPCADLALESRVEALLMVADRPISESRLAELLGIVEAPSRRRRKTESTNANGTAAAAESAPEPVEDTPQQRRAVAQVRDAIAELNRRYEAQGCAFRIESVAGGRQVMTRAEFAPLIARLKGTREQGRLTHAALETLAVIAYRQPLLRADLEAIRGVACGEVLRGLMDRRLIKIVGRADEVGRPMLYGTTSEFLKQFGIGRLDELPNAKDLRL